MRHISVFILLLIHTACTKAFFGKKSEKGQYLSPTHVPAAPGQASQPHPSWLIPEAFIPLPGLPPLRPPGQGDRSPAKIKSLECRYDQFPLGPRQYAEARKLFFDYCATFLVPGRTAFIATSKDGSVGIYMCNNRRRAQTCSEAEYRRYEETQLDPVCGRYGIGQVHIRRHKRWYGRSTPRRQVICPPHKGRRGRKPRLAKQIWKGMPRYNDTDDLFLTNSNKDLEGDPPSPIRFGGGIDDPNFPKIDFP